MYDQDLTLNDSKSTYVNKIDVQPARTPRLEDLPQSELIERVNKAEKHGQYLADYTVNLQNEVVRLRNREVDMNKAFRDIQSFLRAIDNTIENWNKHEGDE